MNCCRRLAGVLYACGLFSLLMGWEAAGEAQSCTQQEFTSATCKGAHSAAPIENASGSYCDWTLNQCWETSETECLDQWGIAFPGDCQLEPLGTDPTHTCYENAFLTFVNVHWYLADCERYHGECGCEWEPSITSQPMQICNCYDVQN